MKGLPFSYVAQRTQRSIASRVMCQMTVQELRANALGLLKLALEAGKNGRIAAAEGLTAKASQHFDDADVIESGDRRLMAQVS
jgi:hypothetical protein